MLQDPSAARAHAVRVRDAERVTQRAEDLDDLRERHRPLGRELRGEALPLEELERDPRVTALVLAGVEDANDAPMTEARRRLRLATKARAHLAARAEARVQELERDLAALSQVGRAINGAETALAEDRFESEATVDGGAKPRPSIFAHLPHRRRDAITSRSVDLPHHLAVPGPTPPDASRDANAEPRAASPASPPAHRRV